MPASKRAKLLSNTKATSKSTKLKSKSEFTAKNLGYNKKTQNQFAAPRTVYSFGATRGFPPKLRATLVYNESVAISITAALQTSYVFACNGLYDPNISGTGHQPLYFDQMMAIYDHYCVINSRITAVFVGKGTTGGQICSVGIDDDSAPSASTYLQERDGYSYKYINDNSVPQTVNVAWKAVSTFGRSPTDDPDLKGTNGANPAELATYVINVTNAAGTDSFGGLVNVTIEYFTEFSELVSIAQS